VSCFTLGDLICVVLHGEGLKQRRLPCPRLPDDIHMRKPIGLLDADWNSFVSKVCMREKRGRIVARRHHADSLICPTSPTKTAVYALLGRSSSPTHHAGRQRQQQLAAFHPSTVSAAQGSACVPPVGRRIPLSLMRLFGMSDRARRQHSAGRLGPQPFGCEVGNDGKPPCKRRSSNDLSGICPVIHGGTVNPRSPTHHVGRR
jgi:hypothetical protein